MPRWRYADSMGKITALKVQKRNPNRVNIYLDGEFAFGLARIIAAWLHIGQELSEEKITELQSLDAKEAAYQQALHYIAYRPRSEAEVTKKLSEKGADAQVIDGVMVRLRSAQLVGDDRFARMWIDDRSTFRPRSHRMLRYELHQKGVGEEFIQQALAEAQNEPELAYQAGTRYARRLEGLDWEVFRKRLGGFLARRGFSYGTIAPVLRQIWDESRPAEQ
ncbi:MAG: RecX family transcriptional regulator [Bellilinea sp.]